ncbi:ornithine cyclodeaminase [Pseudomonas sp. Leaf15]|uniref:ornithine cyclodeaminase family protein n=1 Tax=unclassified Pseudomonas TaxID=196821 RepID=UPI00070335C7|nr:MULTISPECIES: ornithine cyclodeaminase family protein [unclassified Pseudomonas]KQM52772.1 ornithine cyclodeaminase [Pseudomonas sp. Leaf15]RAH03405.1 ornithine cyclodeaminase family protein [Pseudomonas sp. Leaf98]
MAQRATIILSEENIGEIAAAVGLDTLMDETIVKLREALAVFGNGEVEIQPRTGFVYETPEMGLIEFMPAYRRDKNVALKVVGYHPGNPFNRGMPTVMATNSLYDVRDGHLIAVVDGVFATAVRTGASSAVASKLLAHPGSKTLGLIGAGAMAVTQAHALSRIFDFDTVLVHDIDPAVERTFAKRVAALGITPTIASKERVLAESDIICVATSIGLDAGPVLHAGGMKPHVHINAVGADTPRKYELSTQLLKSSFLVPDYLEQALNEGECQQLSEDEHGCIGPELHKIVKAPQDYIEYQSKLTIFDSTGVSLADQIMTEVLIEQAEKLGLGQRILIEAGCDDPMNPYLFSNFTHRLHVVENTVQDRPIKSA